MSDFIQVFCSPCLSFNFNSFFYMVDFQLLIEFRCLLVLFSEPVGWILSSGSKEEL